MEVTINTLHEDMIRLMREMAYLKEYLEDVRMNEDDISSIEEAEIDLKKGRTKRL